MSWQKRNTVGKERVDELKELYESLGFEVKVEPLVGPLGGEEACDSCFSGGEYFVIYTRKVSDSQKAL